MKKAIIAATVCLLLYGCSAQTAPQQAPPSDEWAHPLVRFNITAFNRARAAWEAQGITCYTFEVWEFRGGPGPWFRIVVIKGEATAIEFVEGPEPDEQFVNDMRKTIPGVFDWIADSYERGLRLTDWLLDGHHVDITARYNADYHFPELATFSIGFTVPGGGAGGSSGIQVRGFQPID